MTLPDHLPAAPTPIPLSAALIRAHQAGLWRYCRFLGASAALADDLCQETFLAWQQSPPALREPGAAGAWLRRTARFRFLRQTRQPLRVGLEDVPEAELEACWMRLAGPEGGEDYLAALRQCLALLARADRELIEARHGQGRSREALAAEQSLSVEGLKSRLRRLRTWLRACVARRMLDD